AGNVETSDEALVALTENLPKAVDDAYARLELQHAAVLPVELARAAMGYFEATAPFKLREPSQQARRGAILNRGAQAIYRALVMLLPVLPEKASVGLRQL